MDKSVKNRNREELVKKAISGEKKALQRLFLLYENRIEAYLFKLLKDRIFIKDIKQEVFIKICKNIVKLKEPKAFEVWLNKITMNTMRDYLRHEEAKKRIIKNCECIFDMKELTKPQDIVLNLELTNKIKGSISRLKREEKAILYLKDYAKLSYEDISELLQLKTGTIKSRLYRVKKKLQKMLGEYIKTS